MEVLSKEELEEVSGGFSLYEAVATGAIGYVISKALDAILDAKSDPAMGNIGDMITAP
jgi:bacteriocin-like protein